MEAYAYWLQELATRELLAEEEQGKPKTDGPYVEALDAIPALSVADYSTKGAINALV